MAFDTLQHVSMAGGAVNESYPGIADVAFQEIVFRSRVNTITLTNDSSTDAIRFSFNGARVEGELNPGDTLDIDVSKKKSIYIRGITGGDTYRLWAW